MSDSLTTATPETTTAAPAAHLPVRENQVEAEVDRSQVAGQRVMRSIGGGSPEAPPEKFTGAFGGGSGLWRQMQRGYGNQYVGQVIQRKCDDCEKIQRKGEGDVSTVPEGFEAAMQQSGSGQPLDDGTRSFMESQFGQDFGDVKIHTDNAAAEASQQIQAQAFTTGRDIYFGKGGFQPQTSAGKETLAHELTHVIQQKADPVSGTSIGGGLSISDPADPYEQAASQVGKTIANNPPNQEFPDISSITHSTLHRTMSRTSVQREVTTTPVTASKIIDNYTSWGNLEEEDLGRYLASQLPSQSLLVSEVLNELSSGDRDDVSYEIASAMGNLASIPDWLRIRFVQEMVYGVVTDDEEGVIANIWISFQPNLPEIAENENNRVLWKKSLWESDQLVDYLKPIRDSFGFDVIGLARAYLSENKQLLSDEAKRYGIDIEGNKNISPSVPDYFEAVRSIVPGVLKLNNYLNELQKINVGYKPISDCLAGDCRTEVSFNPESRPFTDPDGTESPPWPKWEDVKTQYDRTSAVISAFASIYPSIYILIQQDKLETLVESSDAAKALEVITEALQKTSQKIEEANGKIGGDITYYDLEMIQAQIFSGSAQIPYEPQYHWEQPFYHDIANDDIKGHKARQFWVDLGLSLVSAAALIAAPFTGGATAAFLVGFGVGIGAAQAGISWDKYLDKSTVADANVKEELALISKGEVSAQLVDAIVQTVAVFLDIFGARATTVGARASREALEVAEKGVKEQLAEEVRKKMLREAAKDAGMTALGTGATIGLHEIEDDEPDYQLGGTATRHSIDLGTDISESTQTTISPMLIQRSGGKGNTGGVAASTKQPIILTGGEFEIYVEKTLLKGSLGELPQMSFVIPGQYRGGSQWGIDRIGIVFDEKTGRINVYHLEMKFVSEGSPHIPDLGVRASGTQTGMGWTDNAIDGFLNSQHRNARAGKERLRRAMKKMNLSSDIESMRKFLKDELLKAPVIIVTPNWAELNKLYKQVAALIRHGREVKILKVFKK
jgi:hypothetical protein